MSKMNTFLKYVPATQALHTGNDDDLSPVSETPASPTAIGAQRPGGNTPVVSGSASRAQQLLQQYRHHKVLADNIHTWAEKSIDRLAEAFGLSTDGMDLNEKKAASIDVFQKVTRHIIDADDSDYTSKTAAQLREYFPALDEKDIAELQQAMHTAHIKIGVDQMGFGQPMAICFGGTQTFSDLLEIPWTAAGMQGGAVFDATLKAAEIFAKVLNDPDSSSRLDTVSGISMGGATAQFFMAALESRVALKHKPAMLLFDPQLLNKAQKDEAIKGGTLGYDFEKLRGVALTMDYDKNPQTNLMGHMKQRGYSPAGLVELEMLLKPRGEMEMVMGEDGQPTPSFKITEPNPSPLLGYHGKQEDFVQFVDALDDFLREKRLPETAPKTPPSTPRADD
ncbi:MAG TPA: hypothetical protein VM571_10740 [Noviherbaspirillum sp.]|nr:hypothetical protein [Noviherbaspirillum sp.]